MEWIWSLTRWALLGAGVAALAIGLFWDRARGRRRCPKCWYDMAGVPAGNRGAAAQYVCPECATHSTDHRLCKTRRRWGWVVVGVVLFVIAPVAARVHMRGKHGWVALIPTSVLVVVVPMDDATYVPSPGFAGHVYRKETGALASELQRRIDGRELNRIEWQVLLSRLFRAFPDQVRYVVQTRPKWPKGVPVEARLSPPLVINDWDSTIVRARLRGSSEWLERRFGDGSQRFYPPTLLGVPQPGQKSAEVEVEILAGATVPTAPTYRGRYDAATARVVYRGVLRQIALDGEMSEVMRPYASAAADDKVAKLDPRLLQMPDGTYWLSLWRHSGYMGERDSPDWALGMRCEVSGGMEGWTQVLYPMVAKNVSINPVYERCFFPLFGAQVTEGLPIRVRLIGDPRIAIRDIARDAYWAGTVDIPFVKVEKADDLELHQWRDMGHGRGEW